MKTDDLTGAALDWAVAMADGVKVIVLDKQIVWPEDYEPSARWAVGGPIIEREKIATAWHITRWVAWRGVIEHPGPTPLIAAMRCFVAAKLGDDIDLPEELNV
jgi:hypothetical protein